MLKFNLKGFIKDVSEIIIRFVIASFVMVTLAISGGLAIQGGNHMQEMQPNIMDGIGGWETIQGFVNVYIALMIIFPVWILIAGREKQFVMPFYNLIKRRKK